MLPKHLAVANWYVQHLSKEENRFAASHEWNVFQREPPRAVTRCSSFLTGVLKEAYPKFIPMVREILRRTAPYAFDYAVAIEKGTFTHIHDVSAVRPGDLLSVEYEGGENAMGFTGHCAIIASVPEDRGVFAGMRLWHVEIIDSCRSSHGPGDTRYVLPTQMSGKATETGGVGLGSMRILTERDSNDPVGYSWSDQSYSPGMFNGKGQMMRIARFPDWT